MDIANLNDVAIKYFLSQNKFNCIVEVFEDTGRLLREMPEKTKEKVKGIVEYYFGRIPTNKEKVYKLQIRRIGVDTIRLWIPNQEKEYIEQEHKKFLISRELNSESNGKMIWYHGTKSPKVKGVNDLDIQYSYAYGDFGKGVYLTLEEDLATSISSNKKTFKAIWCNDSLDVVCGKLKSGEEWFESVVTGPKDEQYKILVITKTGEKWKEVLWNGWVLEKSQYPTYDMVLGPISDGKVYRAANDAREDIDNNKCGAKGIRVIKKTFQKSAKALSGFPHIAYELCVYKNEIIQKCFYEVR